MFAGCTATSIKLSSKLHKQDTLFSQYFSNMVNTFGYLLQMHAMQLIYPLLSIVHWLLQRGSHDCSRIPNLFSDLSNLQFSVLLTECAMPAQVMHKAIRQGLLWKIVNCTQLPPIPTWINAPTRRKLLQNIPNDCSCEAVSRVTVQLLCNLSKQKAWTKTPKEADRHVCSAVTEPCTPFRPTLLLLLPNGHSIGRRLGYVLLIRLSLPIFHRDVWSITGTGWSGYCVMSVTLSLNQRLIFRGLIRSYPIGIDFCARGKWGCIGFELGPHLWLIVVRESFAIVAMERWSCVDKNARVQAEGRVCICA